MIEIILCIGDKMKKEELNEDQKYAKYEEYVRVYLLTHYHTRGCPEDESEITEANSSIAIIPMGEVESFEESLVSNYESQDYAYQFSRKILCDSIQIGDLRAALAEYDQDYVYQPCKNEDGKYKY